MHIGVPKEIKNHEYRVGMTPTSVAECVAEGHTVCVETQAGMGVGYTDQAYIDAGATIQPSAAAVFEAAQMIVKVKEPQPEECKMLTEKHTLFTYLHLAPDPVQTKLLIESGCTAIAYETITDAHGDLPLLSPMSEVAGRMSIQAGAHALEKAHGGRGVLLGGVPGVAPANVLVIGGGVVGTQAIHMAVGMQANVTVLDKSLPRLRELSEVFQSKVSTIYATQDALKHHIKQADLVILAVLLPGEHAPRLITKKMLKTMRPGSVIVDVSIDQGGCCETSRPTTHDNPTYIVDNVVHYCVANMPGGAARTATMALNNATLPYILKLARLGAAGALRGDPYFCEGLNICKGKVTYHAVADALGYDYVPAEEAL